MKKISGYVCGILFLMIVIFSVRNVSANEVPVNYAEEKPAYFYVYYHEYRRNNITCSPSNTDKNIKAISTEEITSDSELFARDYSEVVLFISMEDFEEEKLKINIYEDDYRTGVQKDVTGDYYRGGSWRCNGDHSYYYTLFFQKEGHFQITASYEDGRLESSELGYQENCFADGAYYGPHYTVDFTDPLIKSICPVTAADAEVNGSDAFEKPPQYEIIVEEENFNPQYFCWQCQPDGLEMSSWESYYEGKVRKNKMVFSVTKEGRYELSATMKDPAGRNSYEAGCSFYLDQSDPKIDISFENSMDYLLYSYKAVQIFSKGKISLSLFAKDNCSGISSIRYSFWDSDGKIREITKNNSSCTEEFSLDISTDQEDFCGFIQAVAIDGMGHESKIAVSPVLLRETDQAFSKYGNLRFIYPKAVYTDVTNHLKYYKNNVVIKMICQNSYAGIRESSLEYMYQNQSCGQSVDYHGEEDINYKVQQVEKLISEDFTRSCKENAIEISGSFLDNAGYEIRKKLADYAMIIDNMSPDVDVKYEGSDGRKKSKPDKYYHDTCSAILTIRDWNFNPASVTWHIDGDNKGYQIGKWHGEGYTHWCKIVFEKDGTYRMGVDAADYSGNEIKWRDTNLFSVDKTVPSVRMWMDKSDVSHKKYYAKDKKVYIVVYDDHVTENGINLLSSHKKKMSVRLETEIPVHLKNEMRQDNRTVYSCICSEDGVYNLSCTCRDLAGNISDAVKMDSFIIDKTAPVIDTGNLRTNITYVDDVKLSVDIRDSNLDESNCYAQILYTDGTKVVSMEKKMYRIEKEKGEVSFRWDDFPKEKDMDNQYIMHIQVQDLAGNEMAGKKDILFYVDRFGARYELSSSLSSSIHKYYLNQEQEVEVKAYSLHPLDTSIVIEHDKEEFLTLEKKDYEQVTEKIMGYFDKKAGDGLLPERQQGWYRTTYRISKEYFKEEGDYQVSLRSSERDTDNKNLILTESENTLWTEKIRFAIDKTPPVINLGGLEEKIYAVDQKNITVTAMDNERLKKVKIYIRKNGKYGSEVFQLYTAKDFDEYHSTIVTLTSYRGYQTVGYEAWDFAGNKISTKNNDGEKEVLVLKNNLLRTYYTHPVKSAAIIFMIIVLLIFLAILTGRRFFGIVNISKNLKGEGYGSSGGTDY